MTPLTRPGVVYRLVAGAAAGTLEAATSCEADVEVDAPGVRPEVHGPDRPRLVQAEGGGEQLLFHRRVGRLHGHHHGAESIPPVASLPTRSAKEPYFVRVEVASSGKHIPRIEDRRTKKTSSP